MIQSLENTNILIVDDQPNNLQVLSSLLSHEGYRVRKATSGMFALKAVQAEVPDLILLDIQMPQMNGYEVCASLKSSPDTCDIPIIFLSALDDVNDKVRAFTMGGADYVTKPFQGLEVLARVKHHITIQQQRKKLKHLEEELLQAKAMYDQLAAKMFNAPA
ncbi:response regulator [Oscillatoria sp. FACHB-1407]|uniref:response regulator n=1 Tax=Oscillatoria sp. FACHB-1407 TaxID=2692847 RepID=UPI0016829B7E|nr:response regulator [Oscillatoria sp. FACHB-1407]MBD2462678.1 response regulator [Oscillatoria sp. FACHB-1407]